ncbi:host cell division inhibitor Icd-like protein [Escherichia coli]|uniref:host cell division inhibitor Icd-like protein n=1 Tax=Escherichia coli TaxID=562 RepID=UPI000D1171E8|nr:host cell division inhibitor Icd-like protein [Escherichia coli]EED1399990.1 ash family protein [Escherichia coli]EFK8900884.1 ash family protein [Escherichia coli]
MLTENKLIKKTLTNANKKHQNTTAPYKTGAGIGTPQALEATQTPEASFFVSFYMHALSMVGCMGLTPVRLVSSNASSSNPLQSTASELGTSGGGYNHNARGASKMAVSVRPYFIWRFMHCQDNQTALYVVAASSEQEARAQLPHAHLVFVARIRQGVSYA